jgi:hypothetical protein
VALNDGSLLYNPVESDRAELLAVLDNAWGEVVANPAPALAKPA